MGSSNAIGRANLDGTGVDRGFISNFSNSVRGIAVLPVPEPGTGLLLIAGLLGLAGWRRGRA